MEQLWLMLYCYGCHGPGWLCVSASFYPCPCEIRKHWCRACVGTCVPRCVPRQLTPQQPLREPGVAAEPPEPARLLLPAGLGQAPSRLSGLSVPCPLPSPQAGTLTCELSSCPYCTSALEDPELEFSGSDSGDSDSNGVYEFTQDVRHGDRRDPMRSPPVADAPGPGSARRRAQRRAAGERAGPGRVWASLSSKLRHIVDSKYFNRGIMVAILTNTLSMGVEYHEQVGGPAQPPEGTRGWRPALGLSPGARPSWASSPAAHLARRGAWGLGQQDTGFWLLWDVHPSLDACSFLSWGGTSAEWEQKPWLAPGGPPIWGGLEITSDPQAAGGHGCSTPPRVLLGVGPPQPSSPRGPPLRARPSGYAHRRPPGCPGEARGVEWPQGRSWGCAWPPAVPAPDWSLAREEQCPFNN